MGLYFFLGVVTYLLILVTLMFWFLKYHSNNDRGSSNSSTNNPDYQDRSITEKSSIKPNHISKDLLQAGVQSVSERNEVLPGYCSQFNNKKYYEEGNAWTL